MVALLAGECGRFGCERVEEHGGLQFQVVVIGELHRNISKGESIKLAYVAHALNTGTVAVGDEGEIGKPLPDLPP